MTASAMPMMLPSRNSRQSTWAAGEDEEERHQELVDRQRLVLQLEVLAAPRRTPCRPGTRR